MSDDDKKELQTDEASEMAIAEDDNNKEENGNNLAEGDNEFLKELEDLGKMKEEREEKIRKKLEKKVQEREKMKLEKEEEGAKSKTVMLGGRLTTLRAKNYVHKYKVFKHNKINDLQNKGSDRMEKALHKVHGITLKKKLDFLEALKAYSPTKSVLKKKDFDEFTRRFKSKNFRSEKFRKAEKRGIDMKELRKEFGKRDINKIKRGITGQEDPYKYKSKGSDLKSTTRSNRPDKHI
jgi:hypothetical protein